MVPTALDRYFLNILNLPIGQYRPGSALPPRCGGGSGRCLRLSAVVCFTVHQEIKLYFLSDGVLTSLILFGRYLEAMAVSQTRGAVRKLLLFGSIGFILPKRWNKYLLKGSAVIVVAMGLKMLIRGLLLLR